jgi:hypothetical protein
MGCTAYHESDYAELGSQPLNSHVLGDGIVWHQHILPRLAAILPRMI